MMEATTVVVSGETGAKLTQVAEHTGLGVAEVLEQAVEAYAARLLLAEMDAVYHTLEADFKEWGDYMADLSAWITAGDDQSKSRPRDSRAARDSRDEPASAASASLIDAPASASTSPGSALGPSLTKSTAI